MPITLMLCTLTNIFFSGEEFAAQILANPFIYIKILIC